MKKYIFNPEYVINKNEDANIVFTSDMKQIYILREIETLILECFNDYKTIDEAVIEISSIFTPESFVSSECEDFINELIQANILVTDCSNLSTI